ncbi:IS3 family transposase [Desulfovibrio gilichinskyi]|uniref:IS3 family transposase n=1 Tax=Desulfovibrio gilichinskyi TaxID=1519643 RepID=UPI0010F6FDA6|nr:IS3 family transposase [Desulfovibrio gilichinskyi]
MSVSRSGYYDWKKRSTSKQEKRQEIIIEAARQSYLDSGKMYGYRKVHHDVLENTGLYCCAETVSPLLAAEGLKSKTIRRHRYPKTAKVKSVIPNVLSRNFTALEPNQKWVSDITYIYRLCFTGTV